jgi:hypothetical protein
MFAYGRSFRLPSYSELSGAPGGRVLRHADFPVRAFGGASPFQRSGKEPSLPPLLALSFAEDCDQRGVPLWIPPRLREARIRETGSGLASLDPDLQEGRLQAVLS